MKFHPIPHRLRTFPSVPTVAMTRCLTVGILTAVLPLLNAAEKPNIIVILADDQGYADLGCQHSVGDVRTPHLDALAASGVRCTAGYITAPQCSPSRAGLLTGRYQARFGVEEIARCPLPLGEITIAERLHPAGYRSGMVGKWHLDVNPLCIEWLEANIPGIQRAGKGRALAVPPGVAVRFGPQAQGFDDFYQGEMSRYRVNFTLDGKTEPEPRVVADNRFRVDVQSDAAVAFIRKNHAAPFYLHLCYFAPHIPLEATRRYLDRFPEPMPERRRHALAMLSAVDDGVGRIIATLREFGIERDTLIFYTSDNGAPLKGKKDLPVNRPGGAWDGSLNDPLKGEKGTLMEGGIRVPFLVSWPAGLPAGTTYAPAVSSLDIAATALSVSGQPPDAELDGVDLTPYLSGRNSGEPHEALFWRFWSQTAVRAGDWKLIRLGDGTEQLYNLALDPKEQTNRLTDARDQAAALRARLAAWEKQMLPAKPRPGGLNAEELEWYDKNPRGAPAPGHP